MKKKSQFLDSLMDKRLSFALKTCGFESSSISFFLLSFQFASLFVFILYLCRHGYIFFESGIRLFSKYTRRNVNNFNKLKCNKLFARWIFQYFCCHLLTFFFKINFFKAFFRNTIRVSNTLSVLIWEQLIAKVISRHQKSLLTRKE